ncbi:MAG: ribonuclease Z [Anaerolineales bacterium]|nr:ribonuclease Z [Anaerolineales bacterium]
MAELIILGTATNIPDEDHENTHMVLVGNTRMVLVDGPGNPYRRLLQAGLDPNRLTDIVVTHFHPDHASGIPLLLMALGLQGRRESLNLYANSHCLERIQRNLYDYDWEKWRRFQVDFVTVVGEEMGKCIDCEEFRIYSSPVKHFIPAIGLRIETKDKTLVFSGDTAPTPALDRLANGADILVHEAGGLSEGHSSARQAGEAAARSGAEVLYLVHYPVGDFDGGKLVSDATEVYRGKVVLAVDFQQICLV